MTPTLTIKEWPLVVHLGDGRWGAACERCGEALTGGAVGGVASRRAIHLTRECQR